MPLEHVMSSEVFPPRPPSPAPRTDDGYERELAAARITESQLREFKLEAVRLIRDRGVSYAQASRDLGVHHTMLRTWVKAFADDPQHAFPGHGQLKPEQVEIARLRREVAKLKAERDILKKAAAVSFSVAPTE